MANVYVVPNAKHVLEAADHDIWLVIETGLGRLECGRGRPTAACVRGSLQPGVKDFLAQLIAETHAAGAYAWSDQERRSTR
jgi:hypothetical protein